MKRQYTKEYMRRKRASDSLQLSTQSLASKEKRKKEILKII